jgi:hypothetical protein
LRRSATRPTITEATKWPIVPALDNDDDDDSDDDDECGAVGGMLGRGKVIIRENVAPVPLCSPQILHDLTWARTWAAAVGIQRQTA